MEIISINFLRVTPVLSSMIISLLIGMTELFAPNHKLMKLHNWPQLHKIIQLLIIKHSHINGGLGWTQPRTLHESRLSMFRGSVGPQPLRISQSLAIAEFTVKSFALFMWCRVYEACSLICY